jgi:nitrous oxidase accessory protein NosD
LSDAGTRRGRQSLTAGLLVAATALLVAPVAMAKTIDVRPRGPAVNVIQKAVNKAHPGDRIRVHRGTYRGGVTIDKKLSIFGAPGERRPKLDARCRDSVVVDVGAAGVALSGLKVVGSADAFSVSFVGVRRGSVDDLRLDNTCGQALYGVNVYGRGAIRITDSNATGFLDAGYYVGSIATTGRGSLTIRRNRASGNNRGAIVEDSFGPDVDIRVQDNVFDDNTIEGEGIPSGIFVRNSTGSLIERNETRRNGVYGIHVDAASGHNVFNDNESSGNGTAPFFDEGSGNCGSGNSFPLPTC